MLLQYNTELVVKVYFVFKYQKKKKKRNRHDTFKNTRIKGISPHPPPHPQKLYWLQK